MRLALYIAACVVGAVLALLGTDPLVGVAAVALLLFPLAIGLIIRTDAAPRPDRGVPLAPALAAGLAGTLLVVFLIRLAVLAPGWVDPTVADCGGPSTGTQQLAAWFSTLVFAIAAIPEAAAVAAVGRRLAAPTLPGLPISLNYYPIAVAFVGLALIIVSFATTC